MKAKILSVLMLVGAASQAQAAEVQAVKKSGSQQVADSLYGRVESRLQTFQTMDSNGDIQKNRLLALRPTLGTKIMNEKLDLNLTMPITNKQQSAKSDRARPELETTLSLYDTDRLAIEIYSFHYLQTNEAAYVGYADLDVTFKRTFDQLSAAKIESSLLVEADSSLTTKKIDANVTRLDRPDSAATGLSPGSEPAAPTPEQKETNKAFVLYPLVYVNPSAVPGLKFGLGAIFATNYSPKYVQVLSEDGSTSLKDDGYAVSKETQVRYTVKYQINPDVSVYNQLRQNLDGHLEAGKKSGARLDNRTGITMSLF